MSSCHSMVYRDVLCVCVAGPNSNPAIFSARASWADTESVAQKKSQLSAELTKYCSGNIISVSVQ